MERNHHTKETLDGIRKTDEMIAMKVFFIKPKEGNKNGASERGFFI